MSCPTLETERLLLRPFAESDTDAFFAIMDTPEVRDWLCLPDSFNRAAAWSSMAFFLGQWELRGTGNWALEEKATGRLIGRAGTHRPEYEDWPGVEIGWTLHPEVWGQGFATEAGLVARDYGFDVLGEKELFSCILPSNHRSQAVAQRLGFTFLEERVLSHFPQEPHGIWSCRSHVGSDPT